jgi:hypothetical protein
MGAEGLLGQLEGLLGVLHGAGLEELDDSLLVGGDAADLADDLPDEFHAFSNNALPLHGPSLLGLLLGGLELGDGVALLLAQRDDCGVALHHYLILIKILIIFSISRETVHSQVPAHQPQVEIAALQEGEVQHRLILR